MSRQIHFELFLKKGPKASWELLDIYYDRDLAIKKAKALLKDSPKFSARVTKEAYNDETGEFTTATTFQDGAEKFEKTEKIKNKAELPCFKPDDLYTVHARSTIRRILKNLLDRWCVTTSEIIHSAALLEKLELTGTELQHAIQKYAIAYAGEKNQPVQELVRHLTELVQQAMIQVYKDDRNNVFPKVTPKNISDIAAKLAEKGSAEYLLSGGITRYISSAKSWEDKTKRLLDLLAALPEEGVAADVGLPAIDQFISEILTGKAGLADLLGEQEDLGASLLILADLFLGRLKDTNGKLPAGLIKLNAHFAKDQLPGCRSAIAHRVITELEGQKRLRPSSLEAEVELARKLANTMVLGQGPLMNGEDLLNAFVARSKRLLSQDVVGPHLDQHESPIEKIHSLLALEDNIVGTENKRTLAGYILPIVQSHKCEAHLLKAKSPSLKRLSALSEMQQQILKAGFQDTSKKEIAESIDRLAVVLEENTGLFNSIDAKQMTLLEKTITYLRLCTNHVVTEGDCAKAAKRRIIRNMRQKEFKDTLAQAPGSELVQNRVNELKSLLADVDLNITDDDQAA